MGPNAEAIILTHKGIFHMTDDFQTRVSAQVEKLKLCSQRQIEREVSEKRIAWFRENQSGRQAATSPREAF